MEENKSKGAGSALSGTTLCPECGIYPAIEPHPCPYKEDVCNDDETLCTCCIDCMNRCVEDI